MKKKVAGYIIEAISYAFGISLIRLVLHLMGFEISGIQMIVFVIACFFIFFLVVIIIQLFKGFFGLLDNKNEESSDEEQ